ncbi:MAG: ATP-dependent endonuclease [Gimesia sp.]|nr:ATP-dependent endonuclease [Gimesia sp.]
MTRISTLLHAEQSKLPDLAAMEGNGELIFLPIGGHPRAWIKRLAPLQLAEFHLYDAEASPESEQREEMVAQINHRPRCRAVLTQKRSLENYLHPRAIQAVADIRPEFGDHDCVASEVAQRVFDSRHEDYCWELLDRRPQIKLRNRAKHWLNTSAVEQMTVPLLQERDPDGEVISWLETIAQLAETA